MKSGIKFIDQEFVTLPLGLDECQMIRIPDGVLNSPKPLVAFDFDGTLFEGWRTYHQAAVEIVMMYSDDLKCVPCAEKFKMGVHPDLYKWGVPSYVPLDDAWDIFTSLIVKIEKRNPCNLFPGVAEQLRKIADKFHVIVVTLNSIHPVADIVRREAGLDVDVIVVEDKSAILAELARRHYLHHSESRIPFYYFGDTSGDMKATSSTRSLIYPVAVTTHEIKNIIGLRDLWVEEMRNSGARAFVYHNRIIDVINGGHLKNPMLF